MKNQEDKIDTVFIIKSGENPKDCAWYDEHNAEKLAKWLQEMGLDARAITTQEHCDLIEEYENQQF